MNASSPLPHADLRIAIIGAGPSGLAAGHELLARGFTRFTIFEKGTAPGGTWHAVAFGSAALLALAFGRVQAVESDVTSECLVTPHRTVELAAGVSVGLQADDSAMADRVAAEVEAGYRRIKVKIKPGRDRQLIEAIRLPGNGPN